MANGIKRAKETIEAFQVWKSTQTAECYQRIVHRGSLSRVEIAKAIGCGRSAFTQNPTLKEELFNLESELLDVGILPSIDAFTKAENWSSKKRPKPHDYNVHKLLALEAEVHLVGKESDFKELIEAQCCLSGIVTWQICFCRTE